MKFLLSIGLTAISVGSLNTIATVAQTTQTSPQTPQSDPNQVIPLPLLQAAPLVQATSKLLGQQSYEIESEVEITSQTKADIVANAQILTAIAAPNKVNSEITFFGEDESSDRTYQIVSNGTQVWIYDLEQNQYSVSEYKPFVNSETGLAMGTLANFYLKTLDGVNSNKIASRALGKLPPDRLLKYFQKFANIDLQNMAIRNESVAGKAYAVYDIDAADRTYQSTVYVTPQGADIERVSISGKKADLDVVVTEQIISQAIPESLAPDIFNFIPPDDAQQVEIQIKLSPF